MEINAYSFEAYSDLYYSEFVSFVNYGCSQQLVSINYYVNQETIYYMIRAVVG